MKKNIFILALLISVFSFGKLSAQFTATPCTAGPLPNSCTSNTITLTTSMSTHTVPNPVVSNGTGCFSVGSDITAGTIYDYEGWFTSTVAADGTVDVYAAIITGDPVIGIYSGTCGALVFRACDDDSGTGLDAHSTASGLTPGATVWIRVWDYNGGTGQYQVTTNGGTPPVNNLCASATSLTANAAPIAGTNYCATVSAGDPTDCQEAQTNNNVWYSFVVPTAPSTVTVNYTGVSCFGSGAGITAGVYSGTCGSFSNLVCRAVSDGSSGSSTFTAVTPGTYYVMLDGDYSGGATSLCNFNVDVDIVGCAAFAGVNNEPATQNICANTNYTVTVAGNTYTNTNVGANPCLGWGFWVKSDPLGAFPAITTYNPPTGGMPTSDANYIGVFTSLTNPLANGSPATLPAEGNGATYYIAPVTLSNCQIGEVTSNCFDVGNYTEVTMIPEILTSYAIDCDVRATPTTRIALTIAGGQPSITASSFTLTNTGGVGTLSSTTVANNGTVNITGIPNNGTVTITITDGAGCSRVFTVGPIVASDYCPSCSANAGTTTITQVGNGNTVANNGTSVTTPFILCYGDQITLNTAGYVLPTTCNAAVDNGLPPGGGSATCNPVLMYALLNDYSLTANPVDDNTFTGVGSSGPTRTFVNNGSYLQNLQTSFGMMPPNNTLVMYPFTADHAYGAYWWPDSNNDDCIDAGAPIKITFLNDIEAALTQTCDGPSFTLTGGYPEFFPGTFGVANNGLGALSASTVNHAGTFTITGLTNGQAYNFTVTDNNGCPKTFSGTYTYTAPTLAITGLGSSFCVGDPVDAFTATPIGTSTTYTASTTGGVTIHLESDGYCNEWTWYIDDALGNVVAAGNTWSNASLCNLPANSNLAPIVVNGLNLLNGPFTFHIIDDFSDGQGGGAGPADDGSVYITNNNGGAQIGPTRSGNWGASATISLAGLTPTSTVTYTVTSVGTLSGTDVTQTGNVSGDFDPNTVGTYPVTYTYDDGRSCVFTQSQNVTVNQVPALSTPTNPVICAGQSITLSTYNPIDANGTTGVGVWHVGNTPAGAVVTTVTPTNGQQYCYEWTANGNCRDNKVITVTVNALPTVTATSFTVCQGGSATITAGGASSYSWNTGVTTAGLTINPVSATTTYTVTGTDANTCTNTATGTITMLARPTVTATSFTVCEGSSATITAGGASTYVWNTGVTTAGLTINPVTATTTYTVTGTAANTCTNTATGTITMNTRPTVTATSFTVCQGSSATITAGGANTYVWNTGVATAGLTINPVSATTTYTVTGTAANTCTNTATGTITMNPRPTVTATSFTVCQGGSATITAGGASSYSWNTGVTTAGLTINPVSATTTYTVTGTDANTCTNTATGTITMLARPTVTATSFTVCEGSSATITAGGASTYVWNTGVTTAGLTINPVTATTTYTVTGTAANTCTNTATGTITMNTRPTVTATSFTVCQGSSATITAGGANTYVWNTGVATAGLTINPVSATTTYTVTGTAANTCTNTATGTITMNPRPTVTATSFTVCQGSSATITAGGANTYLWNTGVATAGLTINPVSATTTYTVTGTDANTCTNTATGTITMNPLPTVTAATSSQSVCSGGTVSPITFVTNPATGVTVNWTNSNTGIGLVASGSGSTIGGFAAPVVAIQTQGVISAVATITASGCSNTAIATGTVTINPLPAITNPATPNPNIAICGGTGSLTGFTATGIGAISYSWITAPVQNTQNATGLIAGTYSVVATDASTGCSVTSPGYTLSDPSMPPSPTFNVTSNAVCAGTPITLSVVSPIGGSTYNWSGPSGSLGAGTSITITPTVTGNYNVSVTTAGCTSNPSVNTSVVVNANPTATVTGNGTQFCEQTNFVLSATSSTGGGTASIAGYQWYGPSGLIAGATSSTYTTSVAGSYSVMVTDNNAPVCQNTSAAYVITNYPEPVLSAGAATITNSDCVNPTGSISGITVSSGSANYTYTWLGAGAGFPIVSTIASTTAPALTNQPAGTYTLAVSDANGCKDTTSAYTINNLSAPNTPLVATNNPNCSGSSMNPITLNDVTNVITWYSDPGLTTSVGTGNPFTPVTTTTHTLYVTSTASGCSSAATTVTVTVNPKPAAPAAVGNTYCAGQTISDLTITSSIGVGSTINWYNSTMASVGNGTPFASGVSNNVAATTTTTFFVTELSALLCESDPTQVDITVHPNPLIDTTNMVTDTASCDGTANGGLTNIVVTSGTAPFTFVWTNSLGATVSSSGSSADLDPLTGFPTGSYTLTVTDANTCNATQTAAIVAFNQPQTPTLTVAANDLLYCDGETVNALTAASSHPIFWYPDASLTGAPVGTGPTFTPVAVTTDTTFYLVSNNGCVSVPLSVNIDFHAAPSVPTVSDAVYCRGDVVADLVATGTNVSWFADNITTINIGTGSPFASGVSNAGVTTIWYTDSIAYTGITCGSDTGSVTITIHNLPVIDITTSLVVDSATCGATSSGGSITGVLVTGTPGLTYTWSNSTGVVSTSTTTANLVNQAAGSYTLVVTDGNTPSCSATSSAITINTYSNPTNPVFVTSSDTVYCDGETVTALQANSSTGILQWYSDAALTTMIGTGSPFTPTGITSSTTIYLVASNFNCKSDSIPISINFNQLPNISANSPTVCDGGQVTLSGTNASGNSTTYIWDNGTGPIDGVAFTPTLPGGSYVVTGTDNVTNCVNTFTTTVTVLSTPTVGATVGSSASVCSGGTLTLSGTGASGYTWTGGVVDGVGFTPAGIGSYTVTGTDPATTCTNTFVVNVSIDSPPTINTGVTATIPCGSTSSVITGVTTNATTPVYTWTGPNVVADGNTASPTLGAAGQYTLTVVDNATGCSSTSTLDIITDAVFAALTPDVLAGFSPLPVTFTNQSTGATSYTWDFGDGQTASTTTLASVSNTFVGNGTYTVTLTASSNSCAATATVTIIVNENSTIVVPNIFSPNGDNVNDVLTIISTGLSELTIDIFNRWGSKVYVIDSPGQNWDGKLTNGEPAAEGTYFYILKAVGFDKKEYEAQGPIMLVK